MTAIVPSMHGFAEAGLRYTLEGPDEQWTAFAKESPWMVSNYGAVPVWPEALEKSGDVEWETTQMPALLPMGKELSAGAKFRLTELPIGAETGVLLKAKAGGTDVPAPEALGTSIAGNMEGFPEKVEKCIAESEKSSKPMVQCYNLYVGRDLNARWLQKSYESVEKDRFDYGPYVIPPFERLDRGRLK